MGLKEKVEPAFAHSTYQKYFCEFVIPNWVLFQSI